MAWLALLSACYSLCTSSAPLSPHLTLHSRMPTASCLGYLALTRRGRKTRYCTPPLRSLQKKAHLSYTPWKACCRLTAAPLIHIFLLKHNRYQKYLHGTAWRNCSICCRGCNASWSVRGRQEEDLLLALPGLSPGVNALMSCSRAPSRTSPLPLLSRAHATLLPITPPLPAAERLGSATAGAGWRRGSGTAF